MVFSSNLQKVDILLATKPINLKLHMKIECVQQNGYSIVYYMYSSILEFIVGDPVHKLTASLLAFEVRPKASQFIV